MGNSNSEINHHFEGSNDETKSTFVLVHMFGDLRRN